MFEEASVHVPRITSATLMLTGEDGTQSITRFTNPQVVYEAYREHEDFDFGFGPNLSAMRYEYTIRTGSHVTTVSDESTHAVARVIADLGQELTKAKEQAAVARMDGKAEGFQQGYQRAIDELQAAYNRRFELPETEEGDPYDRPTQF